jgi:hypothetical protein
VLDHLPRDPLRMLKDEPVEVDYVQASIRPGACLCEAAPVVLGREEFAFRLSRSTMAREGDAVGFEDFTMHEIVGGLADEKAIGEVRTEQRVAIRDRIAS